MLAWLVDRKNMPLIRHKMTKIKRVRSGIKQIGVQI